MSNNENVRANAFWALIYWISVMPLAFSALLLIKIVKYPVIIIAVIFTCLVTLITGKKAVQSDFVRSAMSEIKSIKV